MVEIRWKFPQPGVIFLRIEIVFMLMVAALIFAGSYFYFQHWIIPLILALIFVLLHLICGLVIRRIRQAEEYYEGKHDHLSITRKTRQGTSTKKIPWKQVRLFKLDKFFFGGYLATKQGRHPLFFNARKEVKQCENFLKSVKIR